jgi:ATP/maltotriose-dependent transcriptional regulator MalT
VTAPEDPEASDAILLALAVRGAPAAPVALGAVAGVPHAVPACDRLTAAGMLRALASAEGDPHVDFADPAEADRVRDAASPAGIRAMHARWAAFASGFERWRHLVLATEEADPALAASLEAEAEAEARFDEARAVQYLQWARALDPEPGGRDRRLIEILRLLVLSSREQEAVALAREAALLPASARRAEALGLLELARMRVSTARDLLEEATSGSADDPALRLRAHVALAYAYVVLGQGDPAVRAADVALAEADAPPAAAAARLLHAMGVALRDGPRAGLALLADLPDEPDHATALQMPLVAQRGIWRALLGRFDEAIVDLTIATRRSGGPAARLVGITAHLNLVICQFLTGAWAPAAATLARARELADERGRGFEHATVHELAAVLAAATGDTAAEAAAFDAARAVEADADYLGPSINLAIARAVTSHTPATLDAATVELADLRDTIASSDRARLFGMWWLPALASAQLALRRPDAARASIRSIEGLPNDGAFGVVLLAWLRGRLAELDGDRDAALREYERGLSAPLEGGDPRWYRGQLTLAHGRLLAALGRTDEARAQLERAAAVFADLGARPLLDHTRDRIAALAPPARPFPGLTGREAEIAALVGRGWTNPEIAAHLYLSTRTVEHHLRNAYAKLQVAGRRELRDLARGDSAPPAP